MLIAISIFSPPAAFAENSAINMSNKINGSGAISQPKSKEESQNVHQELLRTIDDLRVAVPSSAISNKSAADLWFMKGVSYTALNKYDMAIKSFDNSIKLDPENLEACNNKAHVLNQQYKYTEAIEVSDIVIKKDKSSTNAYINKGFGLLGLKEYNLAVDEFDKARKLDKDNINPYVGLAKTYSGLKKHKKAIEIYDDLICVAMSEDMANTLLQLKNEELRKLQDNGSMK